MLGREFSYELIQAVAPWDEAVLEYGLAQLVEAELLYRRGPLPRATYLFKHALIQDAAYRSLLKRTRERYHQRVASVLVERFPDLTATRPELVAHHFTEAGLADQAVPYWHRAGQAAMERSAYVEALSHLSRGLELLAGLPETPTRARQELDLQLALGLTLTATRGLGAAEVEQAYVRARALCQQAGEPAQLFAVLWGLWRVYVQRVALRTARQHGEELLKLARRRADPFALLIAHLALGAPSYFLGELAPARLHLEQGLRSADPAQRRDLAIRYGMSPEVQCLAYLAPVLWALGYPDQALRSAQRACALARELGHPHSLVMGLYWATVAHQRRGEAEAALEHANACLSLATEQRFALFVAQGRFQRGWALAALGRVEVGLAEMREGLAAQLVTGTTVGKSAYLALLAEVYARSGQPEHARDVLAEALATLDEGEQRYYEAELHRLRGEILLSRSPGDTVQAETCFRQALEVARRQQARSWELRAATSLSRLWQRQGEADAARELLASVYERFSEGFETADLQAARALLVGLRSGVAY